MSLEPISPKFVEWWSKRYEAQYEQTTKGNFPVYIDELGNEVEDKSPYFITISKVLQKRGWLKEREFFKIGMWKTTRQKNNYLANSSQVIEERTRKAIIAARKGNLLDAVKQLNKLVGVQTPVASAILTMIFPQDFCVIDFRVWRVYKWWKEFQQQQTKFTTYTEYRHFLDGIRKSGAKETYVEFLENLKKLAKQYKVTVRKIEMALWQFDLDQS